MRSITLLFSFLVFLFAGCSAVEMQIKDTYVYSPTSHLKSKYSINVSIEGDFSSKKIKTNDDILDIFVKELDAKKIFTSVTKMDNTKADVIIELRISDFEENSNMGLMLNVSLKQLPDKKLIYKKKLIQAGTSESFKSPELFSELLKNLFTVFASDIDAQFMQFTNDGNLPINRSGKVIVCAVFQFKDLIDKELYGDAISSMMMTSLTKSENIKIVERERIQKAVKELEFQTSGLSDSGTAKKAGMFLNADFLIYGETTKIKATYHITMHVVDVKLGEIVLSRDLETNDPNNFNNLVQQHANCVAQFVSN
jgi:TolB-like protein